MCSQFALPCQSWCSAPFRSMQAEEQGKRVAALKAEGKQNPDGEAAKQVSSTRSWQIISTSGILCHYLYLGPGLRTPPNEISQEVHYS